MHTSVHRAHRLGNTGLSFGLKWVSFPFVKLWNQSIVDEICQYDNVIKVISSNNVRMTLRVVARVNVNSMSEGLIIRQPYGCTL